MALSQQRKGEIAYILLLDRLRNEGLSLTPDRVKRHLHNESKRLCIPATELAEFTSEIIEKLTVETTDALKDVATKKSA